MKRALPVFAIVCVFCVLFQPFLGARASHAEKKTFPMEISNLRDEEGEFSFSNLLWLSSPEETEALLGFSLGAPKVLADPGHPDTFAIYNAVARFTLLSYEGDIHIEFRDNQLDGVSLELEVADDTLDIAFGDIESALTKELGAPDQKISGFPEDIALFGRKIDHEMRQWQSPAREDGSFAALTLARTTGHVTLYFAFFQ